MAMKAQHIISSETLAGAGPPGVFIPQGAIDTRGQQAVSQATGGLARNLYAFGQDVQTAARLDMVSHEYALAQRDVADAELQMRSDPDHRSIPGKFSQSLGDIRASHADNIPDPVARNIFSRKFIEYSVPRERQMKFYSWEREGDAQRAHLVDELEIKARTIADSGLDDPVAYATGVEEGIDSINQRVAGGFLAEDLAAKHRVTWRSDTANIRAATSVKSDPYNAIEKLQAKDWKKDFPFLTEFERQSYIDQANTRIAQAERATNTRKTQAEAAQKQLKEKKRESARRDIVKKINFPNEAGVIDAWNDIQNNPDLESKDIEHFLDVVDKAAIAALAGKKSKYEIRVDAVYSPLKERIYLTPESIKDADEIWKLHGKGLSTTDAAELQKTWEDRIKPGKDNMVTSLKLSIKTLGEMRKLGMFGDVNDKDELIDADSKHSEYVTNMEIWAAKPENKNATDKQFREKLKEMTTDDQKSWWATQMQSFMELTEPFRTRLEEVLTPQEGAEAIAGETGSPLLKKIDPKRLKAVETLRKAGKPVTEANIKYLMENP